MGFVTCNLVIENMLIFLYGLDSFRSTEKLAGIKNKFLEKTNSGSVPSLVDFEEEKNAHLAEKIGTGGLFSQKQLVIVKNLSLAPEDLQIETLDFLKNKKNLQTDKDLVLVFWEKGVLKKNSKIFKYLAQAAQVENFEPLAGAKLSHWIRERAAKINPAAVFTPKALEKLVAYAGEDMYQLENEIRKLAGYCTKEIIESDVDLLVKSKASSNIFETIEALSSGNKKRALELLHSQLEKGEDPFYIFSMYVYQFRNLLKIGEFYFQGLHDSGQIAKEAGLHPYVVQKGMNQLRHFTLPKLKWIYKKMQDMDGQIKIGKIDIKLALDKFVAEL